MLQDKLWSDRGQKQGRNSLKQALTQLRKAFGADAHTAIQSNGGPIYLDRQNLKIDIFENGSERAGNTIYPKREFLEGIDIADPQFNHWLVEMRTNLAEPSLEQSIAVSDIQAAANAAPVSIGLFPSATDSSDLKAQITAGIIVDRIATGLRYYELVDVHDFREIDGEGDRGCDLLFSCKAVSLADVVSLSFSLRRVGDQMLVWSRQVNLELASLQSFRVSQVTADLVEQIIDRSFKPDIGIQSELHQAARNLLGGIDRLLRRSEPTVDEAINQLIVASELHQTSSAFAWRAYALAHRLEAGSSCVQELREQADALAAKAIETDPYSPLSRTLLTHVYGFVVRDFDRASSLIDPLRHDEPDLPLYHYVKGFLHVYMGEYASARSSGENAMRLGRSHPYNYLFSCLSLAANALSGDFQTAIRIGKQSLKQQSPGTFAFPPTLRYLAASHSNAGDERAAAELFGRVLKRNPDFSLERMDELGAPFPSDDVRQFLRDSLSGAQRSYVRFGGLIRT
ncbi:hypothetical protein GCM10007385_32810 [Tateyamaria omphalii]|uniref:hypothetical protein n=1 Tax=Tateyamaria omphalii TaxID=299262 RepID=UPI00167834C1|nr:hypothetical protein [Tateyamaria omphalii]GGX60979.1 hypothetical protein GCM10007385_32810 [Tateyamaria omphalii]